MACLTGAYVMGGAKTLERFLDVGLAGQVISLAVKDQGEMGIESLLHDHLGMGGDQHLAAVAIGDGAEQ